MTCEVVKSVSVENLVNQRDAVMQRVTDAVALLKEAHEIAKAAHIGFPRMVIDNHYALRGRNVAVCGEFSNSVDALDSVRRLVDAGAWDYLLKESGLRTFMDASARDQWRNQISEGEIPVLNLANVRGTFSQLYDSRAAMFERGVLECFRRLSWNYKTNEPFKFGKRIILGGLLSNGWPNSKETDKIDDLLRVFHILDGKPEADHRSGIYSLIVAATKKSVGELEAECIGLRWFKKGSGHITFKRPDLVDRLNAILAKHYPNALPADLG